MSFIDQLREPIAKKFGLARIEAVLARLNNPAKQCRTIHIAGTNGKGSTAAILHSVLVAAGYKVGLYTSPHFLDVRERIKINDIVISEAAFERIGNTVLVIPESCELTYFEILTIVAFQYFAEEKVDFVVLETGLGGRLDATNVEQNKLLSVITSIDLDHTEVLGDDLEKITLEKAGIIKSRVPVVASTGHKICNLVIKKICLEQNAPYFLLGEKFFGKYLTTDWQVGFQTFSYNGIYNNYKELQLKLLGKHQIKNASLVVACVEILRRQYAASIADSAILQGLKTVTWPGRLEIIHQFGRTVILDGAHNVAGINALVETLSDSPYANKKITFIFSVVREKDYPIMCQKLSVLAKRVIIFRASAERGVHEQELISKWSKYLPLQNIRTLTKFADLLQVLQPSDTVLCITGSLYGIAEAKRWFEILS